MGAAAGDNSRDAQWDGDPAREGVRHWVPLERRPRGYGGRTLKQRRTRTFVPTDKPPAGGRPGRSSGPA
jgi:hypothetical protein